MKCGRSLNSLPNILSVVRIALTPLFVYLFWQDGVWFIVSIVVFTVAALTDWFDGYFARKRNQKTDWGGFIDPFADKVLIWSSLLCCALKGIVFWSFVWIVVFRDILVTTLRILTLKQGEKWHTLYAAKCKTAVQFITIYVIFLCLLNTSYGWNFSWCKELLWWAVTSTGWLTVYTGCVYLWRYFWINVCKH